MFDSSGDNGPPCGVPSVVDDTTRPASMTPASRYLLTSLSTRLSFTVRATRAISTSWFTRSKNLSRSMSTTHRLPRARLVDQVDNFMAQMLEDMGELGLSRIPPESIQAATVLITIGPIILLYPFVQKYFVKGVMLGSLKG